MPADDTRLFSDHAAAALLDDMLDSREDGAEKAGDVIGAYHLLEKIGEGGFGIVWRAEQTEPVRREVALKLLKRGMDSRQILGRFEQERRMLAAMEHPCIATMLDAGMSPDGRPFFVMEMLRGLSLTKYCAQNDLPLREKIVLFRDVCGGVQHAHQKGVIHRDLKPSNIIVTEVDGRPVPKIIDFGIAKALGSGSAALPAMTLATQANLILGTPQYMSPEQITDGSNVDTRSDIYALGALLYEVLAGMPPFDPQAFKGKSPQEFHRLIHELRPKRPSTAMTTRVNELPAVAHAEPDASLLPADLDWITLRALEKEPQRRYQSAAEFAADLQRFLDNEPVLAHPPSTAYIASRWIRRHRVMFAAACISIVALVAGTGVALWQASLARAAQRRAEAESARSRQTADFLTSLLAEVAEEVQKGRNPEALRLALISSQRRIEAMTQDPELQIALSTQVAELFEGMSDRKLAAEALRLRAERIAARHGMDSREARTAAFKHIHMVIDHGTRVDAVRMLIEMRARFEQQGERGSPDWFEAQRLLVRVWTKLRNGKEAVAVSTVAAAEARLRNFDADRMHEVLMQHADALESARQFDAALAVVDEISALSNAAERCEGIDQKRVQIHLSSGEAARAADLQRAAVGRLRMQPGFDQRRLLFHMRWLAEIELKAKRHADAVAHVNEALDFARHLSAGGGSTTAEGAATLREDMVKLLEIRAASSTARKQHAEALSTAQEALLIAKQGGNQSVLSRALASLAGAQESAGQLDEAWRTHQQLYELHALHNASHTNRLDNLREMARLRQKQGRAQEALAHARDAWHQAATAPSATLDPEYLAYIAQFALKTWQQAHTAEPTIQAPPEVEAWEAAVRNDPSKKR